MAQNFLNSGFPLSSPHLWLQYELMQGVQAVGELGGLPWWGAVAASSVALRCLTLSLFMRTTRFGAWMQHYSEHISHFTERMKKASKANDGVATRAAHAEYMAFLKDKDLGMVKNLLVPAVMQMFIFISFMTGLNKLNSQAELIPGYAEGVSGTWLTALSSADPTGALPAAAAVLSITSILINVNMTGIPALQLTSGGQRLFFGGLAAAFSTVTFFFPAVSGWERGEEEGRGGEDGPS